jgi:hypothetical protein
VPADVEQVFARRKSVVDFVKGQLDGLKKLVAADDRARLDEHLTAIRDVERSLTTPPPPATANCGSPKVALVAGANTGGTVPFDQIAQSQIDLLVLALACDMSPVVSLQLSNSGSGEGFAFLGVPAGNDILHGWVHNDKGRAEFPEYARKAFTWFAERFAYLLSRLRAVNEGPRTLLDSCVVAWGNHFGSGGGHTPTNVPWVLGGGGLVGGRFLDFSAQPQPHNRLLLGIAAAMGLRLQAIGNPKYGTSPLPGLLA